MLLRVLRCPLVVLSIIPIAIIVVLCLGIEPVEGYAFEGSVNENCSVWFDVDVSDPEGAISVHYSTTVYDQEVAMILYDPYGNVVMRNASYDESLRYWNDNTEPGTFGLRVQGWSSPWGGEISFYGTCNYPVLERQVHQFNATGLVNQQLIFDIDIETPGTSAWLVIAWDWTHVYNVFLALDDPAGDALEYDIVESYASDIVTFYANETGTYTMRVDLVTRGWVHKAWVHGVSNVSVTPREKDPALNIITPSYSDDPYHLGDTIQITWISDGDVGDRVTISLYIPYESGSRTIATNIPNDGGYYWTIADLTGSYTYYSITVVSTNDVSDTSDGFEILVESIFIQTPEDGDVFEPGDEVEITWDSVGDTGAYVEIAYTDGSMKWNPWGPIRNDFNWYTIKEDTDNDGSYTWSIPDTMNPQEDLRVRVTSVEDSDIAGVSDQFTLEPGPPVEFSPVWELEGTLSQGERHFFNLDLKDTEDSITLLWQWNDSQADIYATLYNERGYEYYESKTSAYDYGSKVWRPDRPGRLILEIEWTDDYHYPPYNESGTVSYNLSSENHTFQRIEMPEERVSFVLGPGDLSMFYIDVPNDNERLMLHISWDNASQELFPMLINPLGHMTWYENREGGNLTWCSFIPLAGRYTLAISHPTEDTNDSIEVTLRCDRAMKRTDHQIHEELEVDEVVWYEVEVKDLNGPILVLAYLNANDSAADIRIYGPEGQVVSNYRGVLTATYAPSAKGTYKIRIQLLEAEGNRSTMNITSNLDLSPSSEGGNPIYGMICIAGLVSGIVILTIASIVQKRRSRRSESPATEGFDGSTEGDGEVPEKEGVIVPPDDPADESVETEEDSMKVGPGDGGPKKEQEAPPPSGPMTACMDCGYRFKAPDAMFCPVCGASRSVEMEKETDLQDDVQEDDGIHDDSPSPPTEKQIH